MSKGKKRTAIYPGSFDPITLGHLDVIERAARMFDKLIVGVLTNVGKKPLFSTEERVNMIKTVTERFDNVEVLSFGGLSVDFAKKIGANVLVRGLRAVTDFESELQMAQINHALEPEVDTIFFTTNLNYAYLSSSAVKEVAEYDGDLGMFLPEPVVPLLKAKIQEQRKSHE